MSVMPPAARPTMRVIGRFGKSCACADVAASARASAASAERQVKVRVMAGLSWQGSHGGSPGSGLFLRRDHGVLPGAFQEENTGRKQSGTGGPATAQA